MTSCWDLPPPPSPSSREALRASDSGRYSLTPVDVDAAGFEEVCTCTSCDQPSSASLSGTAGWLVLRRRNGVTLAICRTCIAETEPPRKNRP